MNRAAPWPALGRCTSASPSRSRSPAVPRRTGSSRATRSARRSSRLVEANYDAEPVPLADLIPVGRRPRPRATSGSPVIARRASTSPTEQLLVRNRPHGGTRAFEVLVPFRLDDGRVIIVDRGWVPPGARSARPRRRSPRRPPGRGDGHRAPATRRAAAVVRTIRARGSGADDPPAAHRRRGRPATGTSLTERLRADGVRGSGARDAPRALDSPSEDPGPHLSYAIQWILFAIMGFVFIGYMIRTERGASRDREERRGRGRTRMRRGRRRDRARRGETRRSRRDADGEDADCVDAGCRSPRHASVIRST